MFRTAALSIALALTSTVAQAEVLRPGYFPSARLNSVGSTLKTGFEVLPISSIQNNGDNYRHFYVWRKENLYSVSASCRRYSGGFLYAESIPGSGIRSGTAYQGQSMYRAIEYACTGN